MGMGSYGLHCLIRLTRDGLVKRGGAVAEIGAQQLNKTFFTDDNLIREAGELFGVVDPFPLKPGDPGDGDGNLDPSDPLAREFWKWLGFDYLAIDIDGSPHSLPLDLNYDAVPRRLTKRFALVTNFGTTEHVCNQLNAFKIAHDLCAPEGVMFHVLPMQGHFNHGLINYNPKFFWLLARSNDYRWLYVDYHRGIPQPLPQNIIDSGTEFNPGISDRFKEYTGEDCGLVMILQKAYDLPFVAPIDVNPGSKAPNRVLERRYWTVFCRDAFDAWRAGEPARRRSRLFGRRR